MSEDGNNAPWWQGAVIYQVYPRSFFDSNNDGIGDLPGITEKLDYIAELGVDAIWISPFFRSPMKDFGYDVSDYRDVDPLFGSLADFDRLITEAHKRKLKIIIDQVLSHTSDQHAWFQQSRSSRSNEKADWYVWADARADGSPPNNWLSVFGGGAWQWDTTRQQFYLHNFLQSQPDLNFHCSAMRAQLLTEVAFWLDREVDGFRLDAINFCFHDAQLRDNPPKPKDQRKSRGFSAENPYAAQLHLYDNTQPENLAFLEELRALLERYPGRMSLGEINSEDSLATTAEYTRGNHRLHMGYNFELLAPEFSSQYIRQTVDGLNRQLPDGWPCWALSNHDVVRVVTRWGGCQQAQDFAKLALTLLVTLKGSVCLYQGEELGLPEAELERDQLQDPYGIQFWPAFKGRDGCRTPIPWQASDRHCGFSGASDTWLPVAPEHRALAVDAQHADPSSVLNFARALLRWRKSQPALVRGQMRFMSADEACLVFERRYLGQARLCVFNVGDASKVLDLAGLQWSEADLVFASDGVGKHGDTLELGRHGCGILAPI